MGAVRFQKLSIRLKGGRMDGRLYSVVGVNAFEGVGPALLRRAIATFDREDEAARLRRRARNRIAAVEFPGLVA